MTINGRLFQFSRNIFSHFQSAEEFFIFRKITIFAPIITRRVLSSVTLCYWKRLFLVILVFLGCIRDIFTDFKYLNRARKMKINLAEVTQHLNEFKIKLPLSLSCVITTFFSLFKSISCLKSKNLINSHSTS
jgi:hypothetical protein